MRERILNEIRRLAAADGRPPGLQVFVRETGIRKSEWYGVFWARWGDALVEAGFAANEMSARHSADHLLRKVAEAYRHYGRVATHGELKLYRQVDSAFPWTQTLDDHFQTKANLIEALRVWLAGQEEFADVDAMLPQPSGPSIPARSARAKEGLVYLIQSGGHYKIGRSDELERRVKEIRVALPEAATLVHAITTDDPPGIEAYWHRRFADRRANGEWFALRPADVLAFKRRKFQ